MARSMTLAGVRPRDAGAQREHLRPVHRRPRLPPGRGADRRSGPPGLRRLHDAAGDAPPRPRRAGARRDAFVRARDRAGRARRGDRPGRARSSSSACSAASRGPRACARRSNARCPGFGPSTSTGSPRCAVPASRPSASRRATACTSTRTTSSSRSSIRSPVRRSTRESRASSSSRPCSRKRCRCSATAPATSPRSPSSRAAAAGRRRGSGACAAGATT